MLRAQRLNAEGGEGGSAGGQLQGSVLVTAVGRGEPLLLPQRLGKLRQPGGGGGWREGRGSGSSEPGPTHVLCTHVCRACITHAGRAPSSCGQGLVMTSSGLEEPWGWSRGPQSTSLAVLLLSSDVDACRHPQLPGPIPKPPSKEASGTAGPILDSSLARTSWAPSANPGLDLLRQALWRPTDPPPALPGLGWLWSKTPSMAGPTCTLSTPTQAEPSPAGGSARCLPGPPPACAAGSPASRHPLCKHSD